MPSKISDQKDTEATITISCSQNELEPVVKQVFDKLRPRVKAAGFRPGKAPDTIVERELGSNYLQQEVLEAATVATYAQAVREHDLHVVSQPQVQIQKFVPYTDLEYTATVEVLPKVVLPDYKKLKINRAEAKVEQSEIDKMIDELRIRQAKKTVKSGVAEHGDEINFDFAGSMDGKQIPNATAEKYTARLGAGQFVPGFEEALIGKAADEETEFDVTFPADYGEPSMAGQKVHFKAKINAVWKLELPELDQEFLSGLGPFENEKALREDIGKQLKSQKAEQNRVAVEQQVLDELVAKSQFSVPAGLIHQQQHRLLEDLARQLQSRGLSFEEYQKLSGKDEHKIEEELKPEAEKRVRLAIILTEIAKVEDLKLSDAELDTEINRLKGMYSDPKVRAELEGADGRESIYNHLMAQKVLNKVLEYIEGKK